MTYPDVVQRSTWNQWGIALTGAMLFLITSHVVGLRPAKARASEDFQAELEALETWCCFSQSDFSQETVLFTLYRLKEDEAGLVSVAGIIHRARFYVAGLDRRWDFPNDALLANGAYPYSFIIEPDGTGSYYDFSASLVDGRATPSAFYTCLSP